MFIGHLAFRLHTKTGSSDLAVVPWIAVPRSHRPGGAGQAEATRPCSRSGPERAEDAREHEARRRISEERLRIARELHDAVGHHVALISVQAGAMGYLLDTDLDKARESLGAHPAGRASSCC